MEAIFKKVTGAQPVAASAKPAAPCANPVPSSAKPAAPCTNPVASSAKPVQPPRNEVTPPRKKVEPCVKPVTQVTTAVSASGNNTKPTVSILKKPDTTTGDKVDPPKPILRSQQVTQTAQPPNISSVTVDNEVYYECDQESFGQMKEEEAPNSSKIASAANARVPTLTYPTDKMADYVQRSRSNSAKNSDDGHVKLVPISQKNYYHDYSTGKPY